MSPYGSMHPTDQIPVPSDTFGAAIISSALAVVTADWPSGAKMIALSGTVNFWVNWRSTAAHVPSTNSPGTTLSSEANELNPTVRQIPGDSTGYSITGPSSGVVGLQFWKK